MLEYKVITRTLKTGDEWVVNNNNYSTLEKAINALANEGWRVVASLGTAFVILERGITPYYSNQLENDAL